MTWVKIDDKLPNHGKVEALSDRAFRIYVTSICYSSANLTDGEITKGSLTKIGATPKIAETLVAAGLWDTTSRGGWAVHDYLVYNRSKLRVKAISEVRSVAGNKSATKRYGVVEQVVKQNGNNVFLSASASVSPPENSLGDLLETEKQNRNKLLPAPKKSAPTEEWAAEMRETYPLRDFDEVLRFHMNGSYYRGCADKCAFLEGKLKAALVRERNGNGIGSNVTRGHSFPKLTRAADAQGPGRTPDLVG
jgi:hypothetical protein